MERRVRIEQQLEDLKSGQSDKLEGLDTQFEKLMEKYKKLKTEHKQLKSSSEQTSQKVSDFERINENLKEQCIELKERNRLLAQKVELYEMDQVQQSPQPFPNPTETFKSASLK